MSHGRAALFSLLITAHLLSAQEQPGASAQIFVTAIDVVIDVRDKKGILPPGLQPSDFVVTEDGIERTVVGAQYLRRPQRVALPGAVPETAQEQEAPAPPEWQYVLYFENELSSGQSRRAVAEELTKQAEFLASSGRVDVILANPRPHALVRDSRDAAAIRAALKMVMQTDGINQLATLRRHFVEETQEAEALAQIAARSSSTASVKPAMDLGRNSSSNPTAATFDASGTQDLRVTMTTIRPLISQELQLIGRFRTNLLSWLASYGRHMPRTLLLVTDGFDVDPLSFYLPFVADRTSAVSIEEIAKLGDSVSRIGQALATAGWTTVSVPGDNMTGYAGLDDASTRSTGRLTSGRQLQGNLRNRGLLEPREPLLRIAQDTGGSVVANTGKIAATVTSLDDRILLTYQVDRRPDGKPHSVQVVTHDARLRVRAMRWAASSSSEEMAEARALAILASASPIQPADFPLEATAEWDPPSATKNGRLRVSGSLSSVKAFLPPSGRGNFRVTMTVRTATRSFTVNKVLADYDLSHADFAFRAPLSVPLDTKAIAFVIEELSSGMSGVARVAMPDE